LDLEIGEKRRGALLTIGKSNGIHYMKKVLESGVDNVGK